MIQLFIVRLFHKCRSFIITIIFSTEIMQIRVIKYSRIYVQYTYILGKKPINSLAFKRPLFHCCFD